MSAHFHKCKGRKLGSKFTGCTFRQKAKHGPSDFQHYCDSFKVSVLEVKLGMMVPGRGTEQTSTKRCASLITPCRNPTPGEDLVLTSSLSTDMTFPPTCELSLTPLWSSPRQRLDSVKVIKPGGYQTEVTLIPWEPTSANPKLSLSMPQGYKMKMLRTTHHKQPIRL